MINDDGFVVRERPYKRDWWFLKSPPVVHLGSLHLPKGFEGKKIKLKLVVIDDD